MIGRASHGAPWIFRAVNAKLRDEFATPALLRSEVRDIILAHLDSVYCFYGEETGVRIARKHLGWYCGQLLGEPAAVRRNLMGAVNTAAQFAQALKHFDEWVGEAAVAA
jgi:tRNA-dihydrouridine synthase B